MINKIYFFFCLMVCGFSGFAQTEDWKIIASQDGVEFYVAHQSSRISPSFNSIIKIQNSSGKKKSVTFTPMVACKVGIPPMPGKTETVHLSAEHPMSTHNYKFCEEQNIPQVKIDNIKIEFKP